MIGRLRGTLAEKQPPHLLVDVGGVGYELEMPLSSLYRLPALGEAVTLHTHLVVREVIRLHGPVMMGIEQVFMSRNADSALKLGQARGAVIVAAVEEGLSVDEYTASQVKQAIAGSGGAAKEQVQLMVMHLLKLVQKPQIDASDALAIALCHAHHRQSLIPHGLATARRRGGRLRF